jgi:hypothetical protein
MEIRVTQVTWNQADDMPKGAWTECHVSAPDGQVAKELKLHDIKTSGICKKEGVGILKLQIPEQI